MLIDWFTVVAQALNFLVLVWLMKRFLYRPVLDAIAAREKRIAGQIADATAKQTQAQNERKTFEDKNTAFDQHRVDLLSKATADANAAGLHLADEARKAADTLAARRAQALATQAEHLQQSIAGCVAHEVFALVRKTLTDLADVSLEERMVEVFIRRLGELSATARKPLAAALQQSAEPALLRSRFALAADQQAAIRHAINVTFSADVPLRFDTAADAVCGIALSAGGQKLAWTIDAYLGNLERDVAALLAPAAKASTVTFPRPARPEAPTPVAPPEPRADPVAA